MSGSEDLEKLRADVAAAREQVATSAEDVSYGTDVGARTQDAVDAATAVAKEKASDVVHGIAHAAGEAAGVAGKALTNVVGAVTQAGGAVAERAGEIAESAQNVVEQVRHANDGTMGA